ncbi:Aspartate ammonia-lyase [Chitinispirillum alkaliphilum]|nr:Aspartate ammonia-lyase [Chitinispirillum alkaliphilum]
MFYRIGFVIIVLLSIFYAHGNCGRIEEVTVYPDRAQVTRVIDVTVQQGDHVLAISDLPSILDQGSIRISARGPGGLTLGEVRMRHLHSADLVDERARQIETEIESLRDTLREVELQKESFNLQMALLQSLAKNPGGEGELTPVKWGAAVEVLGENSELVNRGILSAEREIRELNRKISVKRRELDDLGSQQRDYVEAIIAYRAEQNGLAQFRVDYTVPQVSWVPRYDFRLDTEKSELELIQFADVQQNSGEDWDNVVLRISTSRPALGGKLPELYPWYIDVLRPSRDAELSRVPSARMLRPEERGLSLEMAADHNQFAVIRDAASVESRDFAVNYRVAGRVSLPGDNSVNNFKLSNIVMESNISTRVVPKLQPLAYLYATSVYNGEAPLLPGHATLYQDGVLVGRVRVGRGVAGDELSMSFGVDERVEVSYDLITDRKGSEGILRRHNQFKRKYLITINNHHRREMEITVLDQIPISRDERIRISVSEESDTPTSFNLENRPGVVAFTSVQMPGEQRKIRFGYTVTFPENLEGIIGW